VHSQPANKLPSNPERLQTPFLRYFRLAAFDIHKERLVGRCGRLSDEMTVISSTNHHQTILDDTLPMRIDKRQPVAAIWSRSWEHRQWERGASKHRCSTSQNDAAHNPRELYSPESMHRNILSRELD
jgi:hypothetical protein